MTLDVQREGGVSTKGPRGGVFVMYNCARLHTLFDSYERGVEKGESHVSFLRSTTLQTTNNTVRKYSLNLRMEDKDQLSESQENQYFN